MVSFEAKAAKINNSIIKRLLDIFFSFSILLFIFPWLYPLIWLLIKLESKGNALFIQDRIGFKNKVFKCYKFRTIYMNDSSVDQLDVSHIRNIQTLHEEPKKITQVGAFLRKTNLDELPQMINVLLGQMSIVGPRPHAINYHNYYTQIVPNINARHLVKPGITGLAQIKGLRGDVVDEVINKQRINQRINEDIKYIQEWSLGLDFNIIVATIKQAV